MYFACINFSASSNSPTKTGNKTVKFRVLDKIQMPLKHIVYCKKYTFTLIYFYAKRFAEEVSVLNFVQQ